MLFRSGSINKIPGRVFNKTGCPAGLAVKKGAVANIMIDAINIAGKSLNHHLYINSPKLSHFSNVIKMTNPEMIKNSCTP